MASKARRVIRLAKLRRFHFDTITDERGSALAVVLILILIMAVLSGMLLMAFTLHARAARRDLQQTQAFYLAEAGIYRALWHLSGHGGEDWQWRPQRQKVKIFDEREAELTVRSRGGYLQILSSARYGKQHEELRVLVGQSMPAAFDQAIVVGGSRFPLVVAGDNQIIGDVTVGSGGVKPGAIRGRRFSGARPVEGNVRLVDQPEMPYFDTRFFRESLGDYQLLRFSRSGDRNTVENAEPENILFRQGGVDLGGLSDSLRSRPLTLISTAGLDLSGGTKLGQEFTAVAAGPITVSGTLLFEDAVLLSESRITIREEVKGVIQAITTGDIEVAGDVQLEYPSALVSLGRVEADEILGSVSVRGRAQVTGAIILDDRALAADDTLKRRSSVTVESGAKVTGLVYSTHRTTIQGQVIGSVAADHFYLYVSPTTYINWLLDALIDRPKLGSGFKLPLLFSRQPKLEFVTWEER